MSMELCEGMAKVRVEETADVTVVCGEDIYHLHADLLAAKSRFFATSLDIAMVEKQEGKVVVKGVKPETFKKVVGYMYEEKLEEGMDLGEMLEAADWYDMEELKEDIFNKVKSNLNTANVLAIGNLADTFNAERLVQACVRFLLEVCQVEAEPRDRWGHTPLWDAQMFSRCPNLTTFPCHTSNPGRT